MSWINGDRRLPEFPTRAEKISAPLWFVLVGVAFRLAGRGLLAAYRHRVAVAVVIGLAVCYRYFGGLGLAALSAGRNGVERRTLDVVDGSRPNLYMSISVAECDSGRPRPANQRRCAAPSCRSRSRVRRTPLRIA
jgi:hypothetical protein